MFYSLLPFIFWLLKIFLLLSYISIIALLLLTYRLHTAYTSLNLINKHLTVLFIFIFLLVIVLSHSFLTAYFCSIIC
nr:MAG TPA: hypothetical protein [Caudoviricetes sp.]